VLEYKLYSYFDTKNNYAIKFFKEEITMKKNLGFELAAIESVYEKPQIKIVLFSSEDIMTVSSGGGGDNLGEWDPQTQTLNET